MRSGISVHPPTDDPLLPRCRFVLRPRGGSVIVFVCSALLGWEYIAKATKRPTVSDLSHRWPYSLLVWGWLIWLVSHLVIEAARANRG